MSAGGMGASSMNAGGMGLSASSMNGADQISAFLGQLGQMGTQGQQMGQLVQLLMQSQTGGQMGQQGNTGQFGQMGQSSNVSHFSQMSQMGNGGQMGQQGKMGQQGNMGQFGQMGQVSQFSQMLGRLGQQGNSNQIPNMGQSSSSSSSSTFGGMPNFSVAPPKYTGILQSVTGATPSQDRSNAVGTGNAPTTLPTQCLIISNLFDPTRSGLISNSLTLRSVWLLILSMHGIGGLDVKVRLSDVKVVPRNQLLICYRLIRGVSGLNH